MTRSHPIPRSIRPAKSSHQPSQPTKKPRKIYPALLSDTDTYSHPSDVSSESDTPSSPVASKVPHRVLDCKGDHAREGGKDTSGGDGREAWGDRVWGDALEAAFRRKDEEDVLCAVEDVARLEGGGVGGVSGGDARGMGTGTGKRKMKRRGKFERRRGVGGGALEEGGVGCGVGAVGAGVGLGTGTCAATMDEGVYQGHDNDDAESVGSWVSCSAGSMGSDEDDMGSDDNEDGEWEFVV
ncbi:hypothetical protein HDV00_007181 [Rhizophlyctis rosea]|nr:hypothetical protein HDV00_007181 [Rhizophlyctis rosea]